MIVSCAEPLGPGPAGARGEIDPVDPDLEDRGVSVARRKMRSQGPRQSLLERLLHPGRGRIAGERAQRLDVDPDGAKPQAVLGQRARRGARQRKPECAQGGERAPASHGAGDHFPSPSRRPSQNNARKAGRGRNHGLPRRASPSQKQSSKGPAPSAPTPQTPAQGQPRGLAGPARPASDQPPSGNRWRSPAAARWRQRLAVL